MKETNQAVVFTDYVIICRNHTLFIAPDQGLGMLQTADSGGQSSGYKSSGMKRNNESKTDPSKSTDGETTDSSTKTTPQKSRNKKMKHITVTQTRLNMKKAIYDFGDIVEKTLAYVLSHTTQLVIHLILLKLLTEKIENSFFFQ